MMRRLLLAMASPITAAAASIDNGDDDNASSPLRLLVETITSSSSGSNDNGIVQISTPLLLVTALPLLGMAVICRQYEMGLENALVVGVARSFVQLMILGMILHPIFVLGMDMAWVVALCE